MITIPAKSVNYDREKRSSFTIQFFIFFLWKSIIFQFCYLFVLYLQGHRSVTSVKLSRAVGLPYLKILHINPGYLLTLLPGPLARVSLAVGLPYLLVKRALALLERAQLIFLIFHTFVCKFGRVEGAAREGVLHVTLANWQEFGFEFHLRSSPSYSKYMDISQPLS